MGAPRQQRTSLHLPGQLSPADARVDARLAEDARLRRSACSASPPSACSPSPGATNRRSPIPRPDQPIAMRIWRHPTDLGVCCSGGGIRAAAFALGALDQLERAGVMDRARWLAAVSGGNYAATSWTLARVDDRSGHAAADVIDWLNTPDPVLEVAEAPLPPQRPGRTRALDPRRRALRRLQRRRARRPRRRRRLADRPADREQGDPAEVPRLRRAAAVGRGAARALAAGGVAARPRRDRAAHLGAAVGRDLVAVATAACSPPIGVAVGLLTVVFPWLMAFVGNWVRQRRHQPCRLHRSGGAARRPRHRCGGSCRKPVLSRFAQKLPYLGGVLLALAALVWAGKVATDAATGEGLLSTSTRWALVVVAFVAVYLFVGITNLSIHRIYRQRLRRSFGVRRDAEGRLYSPHQRDQSHVGPAAREHARSCSSAAPTSATASPLAVCPPTRSRSRGARCASAAHVTSTESYLRGCPTTCVSNAPSPRGWRRRAPPSLRRWVACRGGRRTR